MHLISAELIPRRGLHQTSLQELFGVRTLIHFKYTGTDAEKTGFFSARKKKKKQSI